MAEWTWDDGNVIDPNGKWHCTSVDPEALAARLNADLDQGVKQTWMPGVSCFRDENC